MLCEYQTGKIFRLSLFGLQILSCNAGQESKGSSSGGIFDGGRLKIWSLTMAVISSNNGIVMASTNALFQKRPHLQHTAALEKYDCFELSYQTGDFCYRQIYNLKNDSSIIVLIWCNVSFY